MNDPDDEEGWIIYRAERIPTMYPESHTVEVVGGLPAGFLPFT